MDTFRGCFTTRLWMLYLILNWLLKVDEKWPYNVTGHAETTD
jgi:hypothetical protein